MGEHETVLAATWGDFLSKYGSALWEAWYTVVLGGILFIVDVIERKWKFDVPYLAEITTAALVSAIVLSQFLGARALFVAEETSYSALHSQYQELYDKTHGLVGRGLGNVNILSTPADDTPVLLAEVEVRNKGSQTVAQGFNLRLTVGGVTYPQDGGYFHPELVELQNRRQDG